MAVGTYEIVTQTGKNGLNRTVEIIMNANGHKIALNNPGVDDFEAGAIDKFTVQGAHNVGPINQIDIVSGPNDGDYWDLKWMYVYNQTADFSTLITFPHTTLYPTGKLIKSCPVELSTVIEQRVGR
ncbi:MAG: hypothetical protein GY767_06020 [Shimia sp.]|nr:hypothetical protein [Shimia sp.]MCP4825978.1 hypothetical protein [Shimia sp.]